MVITPVSMKGQLYRAGCWGKGRIAESGRVRTFSLNLQSLKTRSGGETMLCESVAHCR